MLLMIAVAALLLVVALVCWIVASRIDLKRKIKSWSGERTTTEEVQSARTRILLLRVVAAVCVGAAVVGVAAVNLLQQYAAR